MSIAKTVFISRDLTAQSPFANLLAADGWQVTGQSLVQLSPLPPQPIPAADWWFFTSQNGVRFFLEGAWEIDTVGIPKIAALGLSTAAVLEQTIGRNLNFVGDGDPERTALAFQVLAKEQTVLFPAALYARMSVRSFLEGSIQAIALPVYDNIMVENPPDMRDIDVLVFTSPMNAGSYFRQWKYQPGQQVVAIGQTTAQALSEWGIGSVLVAEQPDEPALARIVTNCLN